MFRNILIPLVSGANNELAVCHGAALAEAFGARLNILQVIEASVRAASRSGIRSAVGTVPAAGSTGWFAQRSRLRSERAHLAYCLRQSPSAVNFWTLEGEYETAVMEALYRWGGDLVILSSSAMGKRVVSDRETNLYHFLRRRVSTLMVRREPGGYERLAGMRYKKLLVPVDCTSRAETALAYAVHVALKHQARLVLAHVVAGLPEGPGSERYPPVSERLEKAERYLLQLQERIGSESEIRLFTGASVAQSLAVLSEAEEADLVVLGSRGYFSGAPGLQRSISQYFFDYSQTPVLRVIISSASSLT